MDRTSPYGQGQGVPPPDDPDDHKDVFSVWDTNTGKVLKRWNRRADFAVCPTRPVLAILEANRTGGTRLGFWDFSAENPDDKHEPPR